MCVCVVAHVRHVVHAGIRVAGSQRHSVVVACTRIPVHSSDTAVAMTALTPMYA